MAIDPDDVSHQIAIGCDGLNCEAGTFQAMDGFNRRDSVSHPDIHEHAWRYFLLQKYRRETFIEIPQPIGSGAFPAAIRVAEQGKAALHELLEFAGRQLGGVVRYGEPMHRPQDSHDSGSHSRTGQGRWETVM